LAGEQSILIELGWPAKALSPNGRAHYLVKYRYAKAAKIEAGWATKAARPFDWGYDGPFAIHITAYPPKNWSTGDADNLIASCKAFLDGIASALEVNDRDFQAPTVRFAEKTEHGKIVITVSPIGAEQAA
jgi:crossover junction endodeoxyribonuclease RusA